MYIVLLLIILTIIVLIGYFIAVYNRFQTLRNGATATFNQVKVALKKRLDELSELVDSVKSYAGFEKSTLERVTELRSSVLKASSPKEVNEIQKESKALFGNCLLTVERYPELKTSPLVKNLMDETSNIENEIARLRYTYNNIVQEYNTMIDTIPSKFIAGTAGFTKMDYLDFGKEVEKRPNLSW